MRKNFFNTSKLAPKGYKILDVKVDSTSIDGVLRFVRSQLRENRKFYIVTPNPEQIVRAQTDSVFAQVLNSADISIADGIGLVAAFKFLSLPTTKNVFLRPFLYLAQGLGVGFSILFDRKWLESDIKVIRGRDLFIELIKLANKKGWKVMLIGDRFGSSEKAALALSKNYKNVELYSIGGPNLDEDANPLTKKDKEIEEKVILKVNKVKPELLFIGFGAPRQEKWLYRHKSELDFGGAMVVGGTFDYVSGKKKLPPKWIEDLGLEWLWRLILSNQKIERVSKAFPRFPLMVFLHKVSLRK